MVRCKGFLIFVIFCILFNQINRLIIMPFTKPDSFCVLKLISQNPKEPTISFVLRESGAFFVLP